MAHPNLWGTTDTRNGLPTTTKESPEFSHGECQIAKKEMIESNEQTTTKVEYPIINL